MPYKLVKINENGWKVCKVDEDKCFSKSPMPLERAKKQLKAIGLNSGSGFVNLFNRNKEKYLDRAKQIAKQQGYNPKLLTISTKKGKKLNYNGVDFGSSSNNDFIIYMDMAKKGIISEDEAKEHRRLYLARATKIKGNWKENKESPNMLAVKILW